MLDDHPTAAREAMVRQVEARGVTDPCVLRAMREVPRHRFLPTASAAEAYRDQALRIAHGQTISQPYIVGLMSALLQAKPGDRVLDVGTGCGYQAAVLCAMGLAVDSIEIVPELSKQAGQTLQALNYHARLHVGDGALGLPERAPFAAILIAAAATDVPGALFDQLAEGGRLVAPVGERAQPQQLVVFTRNGDNFTAEPVLAVRFVPLLRGSQ